MVHVDKYFMETEKAEKAFMFYIRDKKLFKI